MGIDKKTVIIVPIKIVFFALSSVTHILFTQRFKIAGFCIKKLFQKKPSKRVNKKKYTDVLKSGGNILGQSASKC